MRRIFIIIISFSLYCTSYSSPNYDLVKEIATEIAKHNIYESAIIGFAATQSTQNMRLNQLVMIASDNQLYSLAKHSNAVVRLYALMAIVTRNLAISPELKDQFYKDRSIVVTLQGCVINKSSVDVISKMILLTEKVC